MRAAFILFLFFFSVGIGFSQISLQIQEAESLRPLPGIVITTATTTLLTNDRGEVSLPAQTQQIHVSGIGYLPQTLFAPFPKVVILKNSIIDLSTITVTQSQAHRRQVLNKIDLGLRPLLNAQEILRMVPGLFIGQHAGGGKAEQIFLRGFDIDHGTDIRLTADGMPVNMVSHAHGQGYADLHFLIPELIEEVSFKKGPYSADQGNFSTAGWVNFQTKSHLPNSFVKQEIGQFNTFRTLAALRLPQKNKNQGYVAAEYNYSDSYFDSPQNFNRFNALGKYTFHLSDRHSLQLQASHFTSRWNHSGQIPDRAVAAGLISHFGAIDDTEGGSTGRTNASLISQFALLDGGLWKNQIFYNRYQFQLFSNFTFFLDDPLFGDQIRQTEKRDIVGVNSTVTRSHRFLGFQSDQQVGIQLRLDITQDSELAKTTNRTLVREYLYLGNIQESNLGAFWEEDIHLSSKWLVNLGARYDFFTHQYQDQLLQSTGKEQAGLLSPKFNIYFTPSSSIQFYLTNGKSFHSNDTRGIIANRGLQTLPPAYGSDLGIQGKIGSRFWYQTAAWYLWLDQEFVYVGDAGIVEPSGRSRRYGFDFSGRWQLADRWFLDADLNWTHPRAISEEPGAQYIPLAPIWSSVGGITYQSKQGLSGSLRYRWLGDRPAKEDYSLVAKGYRIVDFQLNYTRKHHQWGLSIHNLFNTLWKETQFATESRLIDEPAPVEEIHFTAGSPFFGRLSFTYYFSR
ncbi:MAG: TonB-dependent receptor [Spirosomataceae bacterium]